MGRKKQRVRWTSFEDKILISEDIVDPDEGTSEKIVSSGRYRSPSAPGGISYKKPNHWQPRRHFPLAPRFERKAAEKADVQPCEDEVVPEGFAKVRSKNLDILFKKDYYTHNHKQPFSHSASASICGNYEDMTEGSSDVTAEKATTTSMSPAEEETRREDQSSQLAEEDHASDQPDGRAAGSPFYPAGYISPSPSTFVSQNPHATNLFLFSPNTNTLMPCEEIVIPNPNVSEVDYYTGTPNVYFTFHGAMNPQDPFSTPVTGGQWIPCEPFDMSANPMFHHQGLMPATFSAPTSVTPSIDDQCIPSCDSEWGKSSFSQFHPEISFFTQADSYSVVSQPEVDVCRADTDRQQGEEAPPNEEVFEDVTCDQKSVTSSSTTTSSSSEVSGGETNQVVPQSSDQNNKDSSKVCEVPHQNLPELPESYANAVKISKAKLKSNKEVSSGSKRESSRNEIISGSSSQETMQSSRVASELNDKPKAQRKSASKNSKLSITKPRKSTGLVSTPSSPASTSTKPDDHVDNVANKKAEVEVNENEWELIPQELKSPEKWESSNQKRRNRKNRRPTVKPSLQEKFLELSLTGNDESNVEPTPPSPIHEQEAESRAEPETKNVNIEKSSEIGNDEIVTDNSISEANSRQAKRRKKRTSNGEDKGPSKPVLIKDGFIDLTEGSDKFKNLLMSANDVIKNERNALIIKNIGHGMFGGPMSLGRIRPNSIYSPPERKTDEISLSN